MKLWMGDASVHELYTAACGLYFIWLVCRLGSVLFSWVPLGWGGVALKLFEWFVLVTYRLPLCVLGVSCSPISLPGSSFQFLFQKFERGKRETLATRLVAVYHATYFAKGIVSLNNFPRNVSGNLVATEVFTLRYKLHDKCYATTENFLQHFKAPRSRIEFLFS